MSKILTIIITLFIFSLQYIYGQSGFTAQDRKLLLEIIKQQNEMKIDMAEMKIDIAYIKKDIAEIKKEQLELKKQIIELQIEVAKINGKQEEMNKSISVLYTFLWILAIIFTSLTVTTIGLLFWDRKTIIETSVNRSIDTIERESSLTRLIDAFKELAKEDKKVARVLRQYDFL